LINWIKVASHWFHYTDDTIRLRKLHSHDKCHNYTCPKLPTSFKLRFLYTPLFTFHNSGSDRYNCIIPARILYSQLYVTFGKKVQTVWESTMNLWRGTTVCKHVHTCYKLLHNQTVAKRNSNMFENRQTVAQTVKPQHTLSNCLRNSLCIPKCLTVYGALKLKWPITVKILLGTLERLPVFKYVSSEVLLAKMYLPAVHTH
jgi:hypothetical protein